MSSNRVLLLGIAGVLAVASACAPAADPVSSPSQTSAVQYVDVRPVVALADQSAEIQDLAGRAADLVDKQDKDFLGWYLDDATGQVVLVATTEEGSAAAEAAFGDAVVVRTAPVSVHSATEMAMALLGSDPELKKKISMVAPDPRSGGLLVELTADPTDEDRNALEAFAAEHGVEMRVQVVPGPLASLAQG